MSSPVTRTMTAPLGVCAEGMEKLNLPSSSETVLSICAGACPERDSL